MQIKEMKYCKLRWLIMIIAVFFLWGYQENACSDQNMICPTEGSPANEIPACKTRLLSDDEAEVTCAPTITAPQVRLAYRCAAVVIRSCFQNLDMHIRSFQDPALRSGLHC